MNKPLTPLTYFLLALSTVTTFSLGAQDPADGAAKQRTPVLLQLYDVRDITHAGKETTENAGQNAERLAQFVRGFILPELTKDGELRAMRAGHLVVNGSAKQHRWLEVFLHEVRTTRDTQILIEASLVTISKSTFEQLIPPLTQDQDHTKRFTFILSNDEGTERWRKGLVTEHAKMSIVAPKVICRTVEAVTMSSGENVPYVKDFPRNPQSGKQEPEHGSVFEGTRLETMVAPTGDQLRLSYKFTVSELTRPIRTFDTNTSAGETITIQLPEVHSVEFDQDVIIPDQGIAITCVPRKNGDWLVALLQASRIKAKQGR